MCKISVVMPVKNGENFLSESMDSVLNQTFTDFEFLIFEDNSSDDTLEILKSYKDDRIKIFTDTGGYIANVNRGIKLSKGAYIARIDHDDIMDHEKLEIQYEIMENHGIDVCSTWVYLFGERVSKRLESFENGFVKDPLQSLSTVNYMHHSTTMVRREFLIKHNIEYEDWWPAEDYKFWVEIAKRNGKFYMIPKPLVSYRLSPTQGGNVFAKECVEKVALIQKQIQEHLKRG